MKDYTVHDINHVDALWEIADIIAGPDHKLNPAEAFVFGGSILFHDAGMTLAAYSNGLDDLQKTPVWEDNYVAARRELKIGDDVSKEEVLRRKDFLDIAMTSSLRDLHASAADNLIRRKWTAPNSQDPEYLLEQSNLRDFFGETIGQIAASHHWDGSQVVAKLGVALNAHPNHHHEWTVDKVKVALLLRCADAAHIDSRRAPKLLFAMNRPKGIAEIHWRFQSKIAKPRAVDGKLRYTSSSYFGIDEVDAWQLAWDTIKVVDQELGFADEVLRQKQVNLFAVSGADGAKLPQALAKFVQVQGWTPVLPDIMVSDVAHLAKNLGGNDLYSSSRAPLRELIQNAADAIEARCAVDKDFNVDDGKITIKINAGLDGSFDISIEDNGIGMSERVLTGPLIDFGKSFWQSSLARVEYPGLQANFREPRGRYGIGFFSVFMWADDVSIASRPFSASRSDTKILQFSGGLGRRPILRNAHKDEELGQNQTKVCLKVSSDQVENVLSSQEISSLGSYAHLPRRLRNSINRQRSWLDVVGLLCGLLQIKVYVEFEGKREVANLPNWQLADRSGFVNFFAKAQGTRSFGVSPDEAEQRLSPVHKDGIVIGRALLNWGADADGALAVYEKGIFVNFAGRGILGAIEGRAVRASREDSDYFTPLHDEAWLKEQEDRIFRNANNVGETLAAQAALVNIGRINENKTSFVMDRQFVSLAEAADIIRHYNRVELVFLEGSGNSDRFSWNVPDNLSIITGRNVVRYRLYPLVKFTSSLTSNTQFSNIISALSTGITASNARIDNAFKKVLDSIKYALGNDLNFERSSSYVGDYDRRRFLHISIVGEKGLQPQDAMK
ncbi:HD domain-containing protein [Rhizosaccharibacter radicis]|uniref:ATP-binding protein n=1 Tax=Rhizosaccharibacter radicis TaxID=2782605 RepID=A0ABT1VU06_9PROT|nr:ATP-binding protein [Acetobacteraceae bacterium KSS12]